MLEGLKDGMLEEWNGGKMSKLMKEDFFILSSFYLQPTTSCMFFLPPSTFPQ